jgi:hypothetical protein
MSVNLFLLCLLALTELFDPSIGINWYNACKNKIQYTNGTRPGSSFSWLFSIRQLNPQLGLQFRLNIDMSIEGLPTKHSTTTTVTNAACPIELPVNAG